MDSKESVKKSDSTLIGKKNIQQKKTPTSNKIKTSISVSTRPVPLDNEYDLTQSDDELSPYTPTENRSDSIVELDKSEAEIVEEDGSENHLTENEENVLFEKYFPIVEGSVPDEKKSFDVVCRECSEEKATTKTMRGSKLATSNLIRHLRVIFEK